MRPVEGSAQPWLRSAPVDLIFLLSPPFLATILSWTLHLYLPQVTTISALAFVLISVCIDQVHVYSGYFRIYQQGSGPRPRLRHVWWIALACWAVGIAIFLYNDHYFYRSVVYLAVFHFVRQQFGLMKIYDRCERERPPWSRRLDAMTIYAATLYPLAYWHLNPRTFAWLIDGDFFSLEELPPALTGQLTAWCGWAYALLLCAYTAKEGLFAYREKKWNWPKNLIIGGTALSWYSGIVVLNTDLQFGIINVMAHGLPYLALVWLVERGEVHHGQSRLPPVLRRLFTRRMIPVFWLFLLVFAYCEQGLWEGLIFRYNHFFTPWFQLPQLTNHVLLALVAPLLAVPQVVHYILDGYLWRIRRLDQSESAAPLELNWLQVVTLPQVMPPVGYRLPPLHGLNPNEAASVHETA